MNVDLRTPRKSPRNPNSLKKDQSGPDRAAAKISAVFYLHLQCIKPTGDAPPNVLSTLRKATIYLTYSLFQCMPHDKQNRLIWLLQNALGLDYLRTGVYLKRDRQTCSWAWVRILSLTSIPIPNVWGRYFDELVLLVPPRVWWRIISITNRHLLWRFYHQVKSKLSLHIHHCSFITVLP